MLARYYFLPTIGHLSLWTVVWRIYVTRLFGVIFHLFQSGPYDYHTNGARVRATGIVGILKPTAWPLLSLISIDGTLLFPGPVVRRLPQKRLILVIPFLGEIVSGRDVFASIVFGRVYFLPRDFLNRQLSCSVRDCWRRGHNLIQNGAFAKGAYNQGAVVLGALATGPVGSG